MVRSARGLTGKFCVWNDGILGFEMNDPDSPGGFIKCDWLINDTTITILDENAYVYEYSDGSYSIDYSPQVLGLTDIPCMEGPSRARPGGARRGTVYLDHDLSGLATGLVARNIHVRIIPGARTDEDIAQELLPNRILITSRPEDFKEFAPCFDFVIFAVDRAAYENDDDMVRSISRILSVHNIWDIRHGALVEKGKETPCTITPLVD